MSADMPAIAALAEEMEPLRLPPLSNVDVAPKCWRCGRLLTRHYFGRPWKVECSRCKAKNASEPAA